MRDRYLGSLVIVFAVSTPVRLAAQVTLGSEFQVNSYTTKEQLEPSVAVGATGEFVVVWSSVGQDGSGAGIFGQRFDSNGASVGTEFQANTVTTNDQRAPAVAKAPNGNYVIIWEHHAPPAPPPPPPATEDSTEIVGRCVASSGAPLGGEFHVNTFTTASQTYPDVAIDSSGKFVVVWQDSGLGGKTGIFGRQFQQDCSTQSPEFQVDAYAYSFSFVPHVATDASGGFIVVWRSVPSPSGDASDIVGRRFNSSGAPLGSEFVVNSYTTGYQLSPDVAVNPSGNFLVVWSQYYHRPSPPLDMFGVFARIFNNAGVPLGNDFQINSTTTVSQWSPAAVALPDGTFLVAWSSLVASENTDVLARHLSSTGAALGSEFQVNTYTSYYQGSDSLADAIAVSTGATGQFVIVWDSVAHAMPESASQDGSLNGVFGQRFGPRPPICGNEPTCGGTIPHPCQCGDTVKWNYTLSGTLTCNTPFALKIGSGVTLTGDGTAVISGPATPIPNSIGIYFDGSNGATVTSTSAVNKLQVTNFQFGVRFDHGARDNVLEYIESHHNTQYGIDLRSTGASSPNTTNNHVQNVSSHDNQDEGIHMGFGSYGNFVQDSTFSNNRDHEVYLTNTDDNKIMHNTLIGSATGKASLTVKDSDRNCIVDNAISNTLVNFSDDADHNTFGTSTLGNTITGARLQFAQDKDDMNSTLPYRPGHDNAVTKLSVSNNTGTCIQYKRNSNATGGDEVPYNNTINSSVFACTGTSLQSVAGGTGTPVISGQNCIGGMTMCNTHPCAEPGDTSDPLGIIMIQSNLCSGFDACQ